MPPLQTDWLPAVIALLSGAVIGLAVAWTNRRKAEVPTRSPRPAELGELLATHDSILGRLHEIEDGGHEQALQQRARERYALELEAALALRAIQLEASREAAISRAIADASPRRSGMVNVVGGIACAGAIGALLLFVSSAADQRPPGGSLTGQSAATATDSRPMPHPDVAALEARVKTNPDDFEAHLALAQAYLVQKNLMGTYQQTQYVLERQPEHPVALTYGAIVRLAMGESEEALGMLERAIALNPGLLDAWAYKAMALAKAGRTVEAAQVIRDAGQRFPESRSALEAFLGGSPGKPSPKTGSR